MLRSTLFLSAVAVAALATMPAQAQTRHRFVSHTSAPPLTVTKRSWLDVGNVVPVGTENTYLAAETTLHQPVYASYSGFYGVSALPGPLDLGFSNENPRVPSSGGIFFDDLP